MPSTLHLRAPHAAAPDGAATARRRRPQPRDPAVSLIVSTRNRARYLTAFLESLEQIETRHAWEAIIVDNGSTDASWAILEAFAEVSRHKVRLAREPTPGLSYGRNAGVRMASGAILAFTDDDCYPRPDFIDAIADLFARHEVGFIGGQVLLFDPADDPVCITERTCRKDLPAGDFITTGEVQGACMAFRREVFDAVGLFDPAFGAGAPLIGAEDCEMVARASYAGWRGGFFPEAVVFHHHRRRGAAAHQINHGYDFARGAYLAKLLLKTPGRRLSILEHWYWDTPLIHRPSARVWRKMWRELQGARRYLLGYAGAEVPRLEGRRGR